MNNFGFVRRFGFDGKTWTYSPFTAVSCFEKGELNVPPAALDEVVYLLPHVKGVKGKRPEARILEGSWAACRRISREWPTGCSF